MINIAPAFTADDIEPEHMTLHGDYKASIRNAYIVHISKKYLTFFASTSCSLIEGP